MEHLASGGPGLARARGAGDAPPPRDIGALVATHPGARFLDMDTHTLALILPQFEAATATTAGPATLLSERGGYAKPRMAGERLASPPGRIALRLVAGRGEHIACTAADPGRREPAALHLFDRGGRLTHRTQIATPGDLLTLAALLAEIPTLAPSLPAPDVVAPAARPTPYLPAIRHARETWATAELVRHIDDLVLDGGQARRTCLPHVGAAAARRVDPLVIGHLLREVAQRRLPFRHVAVRAGCVQTREGALDTLRPEGDLLLMRSGTALMALDLGCIMDAWVTCLGPAGRRSRALELYASDGTCAAAFLPPTQAPAAQTAWDRLLASLPAFSASSIRERDNLVLAE